MANQLPYYIKCLWSLVCTITIIHPCPLKPGNTAIGPYSQNYNNYNASPGNARLNSCFSEKEKEKKKKEKEKLIPSSNTNPDLSAVRDSNKFQPTKQHL